MGLYNGTKCLKKEPTYDVKMEEKKNDGMVNDEDGDEDANLREPANGELGEEEVDDDDDVFVVDDDPTPTTGTGDDEKSPTIITTNASGGGRYQNQHQYQHSQQHQQQLANLRKVASAMANKRRSHSLGAMPKDGMDTKGVKKVRSACF